MELEWIREVWREELGEVEDRGEDLLDWGFDETVSL